MPAARPIYYRWALAIAGIAAPVAFAFFAPLTGGPVLCTFRNLTGWDCPGCGLTRSVVAFVHADVGTSLRAHPLGAIVFLLFMALWGGALVCWARTGRFVSPIGVRTPTWAFAAFFAVYLGVYALRLAGMLGGPADPPAPGLVGTLW